MFCSDMAVVSKFGGSSILQFEQVVRIVESDDAERQWVVVSAPSDADKKYRVTQMLIRLADLYRNSAPTHTQRIPSESVDELRLRIGEKFSSVFGGKVNFQVKEQLEARLKRLDLMYPAYLANMKAFGEDMTARLVASELEGFEYANLRDVMLVDGPYDAASVRFQSYAAMKNKLSKGKFVIPGFFGYDTDQSVKTFAFGGSDKTGAEIARGVGAVLYENFTDSPIRTADPRLVPGAKVISEMTLTELRDLSYAGFGIYHSEAIEPLVADRIPIHVRSTKDFPATGTFVRADRVDDVGRPVVGVAYREGLCAFSLSRVGLNDMMGVLADTAVVLKKHGIAVEFPAVGIDDVSYVASQDTISGSSLDAIASSFSQISRGGKFVFYDHLGCVVIAGKGIERNPLLVSSRASSALASSRVDVLASSMGIERRCILYAVPCEQGELAVKTLYDTFIV